MKGPEPPQDELAVIKESRRATLVKVDQPVVQISQLPRSGGTLLMRLFDGHPECHTFPHEFGSEFGRTVDPEWSLDEAWEHLHDKKLADYFRVGFSVAQRKASDDSRRVPFPLLISPSFQRAIFDELYPTKDDFSPRKAFGAYQTSYFNAWIDNQNLFAAPKKWVVAFEAAGVLSGGFRENFEAHYPDGRLISIIREPQSWFASAQGWSLRWAAVNPGMEVWRNGVEKLLRVKREIPERMTIVLFSDLVKHPVDSMNMLGEWLDIRPARECEVPTFNGRPVVPNTSFKLETTEVSTAPLKRAKSLTEQERNQIDRLAGDLMDQVFEIASRPRLERVKATKAKTKGGKKDRAEKAQAKKDKAQV